MTVSQWLDSRMPRPPAALSARMPPLLEAAGETRSEQLARVACEAVDRVRARPGRVRESALDLLVADALLTYACEAALELDAPREALLDVMRRTVEGR